MGDLKKLQEELWWQNLDNWIFDDAKIITYKNLAASLKVHVNLAKKMLYSFYMENESKLTPSFLLSGTCQGLALVKVVSKEKLAKEEKKFSQFTKHIFSLSKAKSLDKVDLLRADMDWRSNCETMAGLRAIKHDHEVKVRKVAVEKPKAPAVKKEEVIAKESIQKQPVKSNNKIASMFAKAPPKKVVTSKETPKQEPKKAVNVKKEEEPPKEEIANKENKEKNAKKRDTSHEDNNLKASKRHKRIQLMDSSSEDEESESEDAPADMQDNEEEEEVKKSPEKAQSDSDDFLQATPQEKTLSKKRRGRKTVDKTFFDKDSGFMITKKVNVSCSEESDEDEDKKKPSAKETVSPVIAGKKSPVKKAKKSPVKKQPSKPGGSKQSSIKSFFGKK